MFKLERFFDAALQINIVIYISSKFQPFFLQQSPVWNPFEVVFSLG